MVWRRRAGDAECGLCARGVPSIVYQQGAIDDHFGDAELLDDTGALSGCRPRQATDASGPASSPRPSPVPVRGCMPALGPAPRVLWGGKDEQNEVTLSS